MNLSQLDLFQDQQRSNWVRLRTLVILRWVAIAGQVAAILAARFIYDMTFATGLAVMTVGISVVANLISTFLTPENRRLTEREAMLMMVFDILQLGLLLYLTGGLNNPFALLLLAPVTIAATVLHLRSTALVAALAIIIISALSFWHLPLLTASGLPLALPPLVLFGFWLALLIGVVFLSVYARQVTTEMNVMSEALVATQMALAREQKLTDLGGVVAAAAHELGTPLATIKLVSSELIEVLGDDAELREDAELIRDQANRCRDILRSMGRAGKDDLYLRHAPLELVVREAAEPHLGRGVAIVFVPSDALANHGRQPQIERRPEIIHGLRNLIQNAVDFAADEVRIEAEWTDQAITVRIEDDGSGFPQSVIGRIGDPFVRRRRAQLDGAKRPDYEGMGLGLFIAKTLLERTGARLIFANSAAAGGAVVLVEWPRSTIESDPAEGRVGLGENRPIHA